MPGSELPSIHSESLGFIEATYAQYVDDPDSVAPEWRQFFENWPENGDGDGNGHARLGPSFRPPRLFEAGAPRKAAKTGEREALQERVDLLIRNHRVRGHIVAQLDPLGTRRLGPPELDPAFYGFTEADLDRTFSTKWAGGSDQRKLRDIIEWLQNTYCRSIGVQFMHIDSLRIREWLQQRMESTQNRLELSRQEQLRILKRLTDAVVFEEFLQKKYIGAKSFSLEGGESLIPLLDLALEKAGDDGVEEIVLAMAHRGRLNVLSNIMGKRPSQVFREFEDVDSHLKMGQGDVKYHLGYSGDWITQSGKTVHMSLCFNPSHLEYVNGVALGRTRAKQERRGDEDGRKGMCILIHGDAAFAGEGVVQETLNLSLLDAYGTGGTLHVIVNNQIGFTTGPSQGRSSQYATDVARMLSSPIFHVNGEDPEAVAQVVRLALDFRRTFAQDVFIDMYCYRQRGHNEGDEPGFTQPVMYRAIEQRKSIRDSYLDRLLEMDGINSAEAFRISEASRANLESELALARSPQFEKHTDKVRRYWEGFHGGPVATAEVIDTGFDKQELSRLLAIQTVVPENFKPHPKVEKILAGRREMAEGKRPLDWASAEALAFATLLTSGVRIRMTGQDCERGTFSQRHSVLHDHTDDHTWMPLAHLADDQAPVTIANSSLSESGVLGFDYGYSLDFPEALVLWEAQFGDFVNAAQVIIDQFLCSAEDKWNRLSGLVLLLPHGYEGQGPEHSSARLERCLSLAAEDNIQVINATTPAQYFHMLRRQVLRKWRKPLIMMTPKSLLRLPAATSSLDECATGRFQEILPDPTQPKPSQVSRILLCSGKVYYDLAQHRQEQKRDDVVLVRIEQLYPLLMDQLETVLADYPKQTPVIWVQEEPENMGAWPFLRLKWGETVLSTHPFRGIFRPESASPATGSQSAHKQEQKAILDAAFG